MSGQLLDTPLGNKLRSLGEWTAADLSALGHLSARRRRVDAHQLILHEHDTADDAYLIQSGWSCTYKVLPDGGRQILSFPLPGDVVGLSNLGLERSAFGFESLTEAEISPISLAGLMKSVSTEPTLARVMLWSIARDSAIAAEHLTNIGRRSALTRTAHFILELAFRLSQIGIDTNAGFSCPINQHLFADALSMTSIHLNRVLRQLREADLMVLKLGRIEIRDLEGLTELAAFDPGYLSVPIRTHQ